jgi:hypothetical protein
MEDARKNLGDKGMQADLQWHLDKKVPIMIIATIILQTFSFVWFGSAWKSSMEERMRALEESRVETRGNNDRIVSLEKDVEYIREGITEVKTLVRSLANGSGKPAVR